MQHAVALVPTALAALVLAGSASVTYGLSAICGAGLLTQGARWVILVLVPRSGARRR